MYWERILDEVLRGISAPECKFSEINYEAKIRKNRKKVDEKSSKKKEIYPLGGELADIHFSKQEAKCMVCLLKGKSTKGIARALDLSPRTVEYYVKNMKRKLQCRTKFELMELVSETDFRDYLDDESLNC